MGFQGPDQEEKEVRAFKMIIALVALLVIVFLLGLQLGLREGREDRLGQAVDGAFPQTAAYAQGVMK